MPVAAPSPTTTSELSVASKRPRSTSNLEGRQDDPPKRPRQLSPTPGPSNPLPVGQVLVPGTPEQAVGELGGVSGGVGTATGQEATPAAAPISAVIDVDVDVDMDETEPSPNPVPSAGKAQPSVRVMQPHHLL